MPSFNPNHVVLVHPLGYSAESAQKDIARIANLMPPLGLASIAAYLQLHDIESTIVDCFAQPDSDHLIQDILQTKQPAFIGISCTTSGDPANFEWLPELESEISERSISVSP